MRPFQLNLLGVDVSFRADADPQFVEQALQTLEVASERLKNSGGQYSRERLLVLVALGVAYDLLQTRHELDEVKQRLATMLKSIEELA